MDNLHEYLQDQASKAPPTQPSTTGASSAQGDASPLRLGVVTGISDVTNSLYQVALLDATGSVVKHFNNVASWQTSALVEGSKVWLIFPNGVDQIPIAFSGGGDTVSATGSISLVLAQDRLFLS